MVTKDVAKRFSAKKIIEQIAPIIEGRGGGKDEMAQAGGKNTGRLAEALEKARSVIERWGLGIRIGKCGMQIENAEWKKAKGVRR